MFLIGILRLSAPYPKQSQLETWNFDCVLVAFTEKHISMTKPQLRQPEFMNFKLIVAAAERGERGLLVHVISIKKVDSHLVHLHIKREIYVHCYLSRDYLYLIYFNCVYDGASRPTHEREEKKKNRMMYIYSRRVCGCVPVYGWLVLSFLLRRSQSVLDLVLDSRSWVREKSSWRHHFSSSRVTFKRQHVRWSRPLPCLGDRQRRGIHRSAIWPFHAELEIELKWKLGLVGQTWFCLKSWV